MRTVLQVQGLPNGEPTAWDGEYVKDFDFEYLDGRGLLTSTPDVKEAMVFENAEKAIEFWRTQPKCKPMRNDGRPNRPLTATNIAFCRVDKEGNLKK